MLLFDNVQFCVVAGRVNVKSKQMRGERERETEYRGSDEE